MRRPSIHGQWEDDTHGLCRVGSRAVALPGPRDRFGCYPVPHAVSWGCACRPVRRGSAHVLSCTDRRAPFVRDGKSTGVPRCLPGRETCRLLCHEACSLPAGHCCWVKAFSSSCGSRRLVELPSLPPSTLFESLAGTAGVHHGVFVRRRATSRQSHCGGASHAKLPVSLAASRGQRHNTKKDSTSSISWQVPASQNGK